MRRSNIFKLLLACILAGGLALAGCGSDGTDGTDGTDGVNGVNGVNGQGFNLPEATQAGLVACSTCHGSSTAATEWVDSDHAMNSDHSLAACATECHNPSGAMFEMAAAFGVNPTGTVVGCEDCHGAGSNHVDLPNTQSVANTAPTSDICGQCHDGEGELAHLEHHPINEQIFTRFELSGHSDSHPREAFCSACHSHEGALQFFAMGGADNVDDLFKKYNPDTVNTWDLVEEELSTKQCNTCHDPHKASLRTDDTLTENTDEVVYSAQFNLCTTCHMVKLDAVSDGGGLFDYSLSTDSYSAANMVDAATGTFGIDEFDFVNADGSIRAREIYPTQIFYHDNTPHGERSFVDTHFAGTVVGRVAAVDETDPADAIADVTLAGYNVNAASPEACTVCHDPHSANKVEGDSLAPAVANAEGVAMFHNNYLADDLSGHGCQPCHDGGASFLEATHGADFGSAYGVTNVIACRTCHELEQIVTVDGVTELGDPTAVREFDASHAFAFPGHAADVDDSDEDGDVTEILNFNDAGAPVAIADLGVNQICFECHKGREGVKPGSDTTTLVYGVSYLHYAPSAAILFGNESEMVPTYAGKDYTGKFVHNGGALGTGSAEFGCVDCHNVHDTQDNNVVLNKMTTSADCKGCHEAGATNDAVNILRPRTVAFGDRLLETLVSEYNTLNSTTLTEVAYEAIITSRNEASDVGDNDLAIASSIFTIFNYYDGSPQGTIHGHGGSWAHNSKFARQVQYDAIESLGGDLTDLIRPAL